MTMSPLSLRFLGTFHASRDNVALTSFRSDKARALLAFLALEADRPHRREALAALFWPDRSERAGKANLRQTLSRLKRALKKGDDEKPLLKAARQTLQLDLSPEVFLDTRAFSNLLGEVEAHAHPDLAACPDCVARLEAAAALFRGDLLEGVSVQDSEPFEEWLLVERERFRQRALELMFALAAMFGAREDFARAQFYARRQLALEPWREEAHRQLVRGAGAPGRAQRGPGAVRDVPHAFGRRAGCGAHGGDNRSGSAHPRG